MDSSTYQYIAALSFIPEGINILIASIYVADTPGRFCLTLISLFLFLVAPCHLAPLPLNKYGKLSTSTFLIISLLVSISCALGKPGIIIPAIIVEIPTFFYLIKYQVLQRMCRFLERQQKVAAYKKIAEPIGWMHYPMERILAAAYYCLVFLVFGISFYMTTESAIALIVFSILSVSCLFLCVVWITSIIVFNQEIIQKISPWKIRRYDIKTVKEIQHGRLRWNLRGAECGTTLRIAGAMKGNMQLMLSLFKKRMIWHDRDG